MIAKVKYWRNRYFEFEHHGKYGIYLSEGTKNIAYWDLIELHTTGLFICGGEASGKYMDNDASGKLKIIGVDVI